MSPMMGRHSLSGSTAKAIAQEEAAQAKPSLNAEVLLDWGGGDYSLSRLRKLEFVGENTTEKKIHTEIKKIKKFA